MNKVPYVIDKRNKLYGLLAPELYRQAVDNAYAKYKVIVRDDGKLISVFCGNGLVVYVESPSDLPESIGWNLVCARAHGMQPLYLDSVVTSGLRMDAEHSLIPSECRDVGWRLAPSYYVIITPERELIDLQIKYTGQYYSERVI